METEVAELIIYHYQMEDFVNILLAQDYKVQIEKYNNDKILINVIDKFKINDKEEEE